MTSFSTTIRRARRGIFAGVALLPALAVAACSGQGNTMTAPSSTGGSTLVQPAQPGNGAVKNFSVTVSPVQISANTPSSLTVTITNASTSTIDLGSAQIIVPSGLTVTSVGTITAGTAGNDYWATNWTSGQTITVGAQTDPAGGQGSGAGNQKLQAGETATFQVGVTATVCQINTFQQPTASGETLATFAPDSSWVYTGSALTVEVINCACTETLGQGYWEHHSTWPVTSLYLGTHSYTQAQLLTILQLSVGGNPQQANALVQIAHQLIAAKLNIANGAAAPSDPNLIANADAMIGSALVPPVGSDFLATSGATGALVQALDAYNNSCPAASTP